MIVHVLWPKVKVSTRVMKLSKESQDFVQRLQEMNEVNQAAAVKL